MLLRQVHVVLHCRQWCAQVWELFGPRGTTHAYDEGLQCMLVVILPRVVQELLCSTV